MAEPSPYGTNSNPHWQVVTYNPNNQLFSTQDSEGGEGSFTLAQEEKLANMLRATLPEQSPPPSSMMGRITYPVLVQEYNDDLTNEVRAHEIWNRVLGCFYSAGLSRIPPNEDISIGNIRQALCEICFVRDHRLLSVTLDILAILIEFELETGKPADGICETLLKLSNAISHHINGTKQTIQVKFAHVLSLVVEQMLRAQDDNDSAIGTLDHDKKHDLLNLAARMYRNIQVPEAISSRYYVQLAQEGIKRIVSDQSLLRGIGIRLYHLIAAAVALYSKVPDMGFEEIEKASKGLQHALKYSWYEKCQQIRSIALVVHRLDYLNESDQLQALHILQRSIALTQQKRSIRRKKKSKAPSNKGTDFASTILFKKSFYLFTGADTLARIALSKTLHSTVTTCAIQNTKSSDFDIELIEKAFNEEVRDIEHSPKPVPNIKPWLQAIQTLPCIDLQTLVTLPTPPPPIPQKKLWCWSAEPELSTQQDPHEGLRFHCIRHLHNISFNAAHKETRSHAKALLAQLYNDSFSSNPSFFYTKKIKTALSKILPSEIRNFYTPERRPSLEVRPINSIQVRDDLIRDWIKEEGKFSLNDIAGRSSIANLQSALESDEIKKEVAKVALKRFQTSERKKMHSFLTLQMGEQTFIIPSELVSPSGSPSQSRYGSRPSSIHVDMVPKDAEKSLQEPQ